jgi:hypothetical protein
MPWRFTGLNHNVLDEQREHRPYIRDRIAEFVPGVEAVPFHQHRKRLSQF